MANREALVFRLGIIARDVARLTIDRRDPERFFMERAGIVEALTQVQDDLARAQGSREAREAEALNGPSPSLGK